MYHGKKQSGEGNPYEKADKRLAEINRLAHGKANWKKTYNNFYTLLGIMLAAAFILVFFAGR